MTTWPGVPMQQHKDNIYKAAVPSDATFVIFNSDSGGAQTDDIPLQGFNKIYSSGSWSDYTG